jgi:colanic acid/amylovoran biosynthesis glycosyltransferase
MPVVGTRHAGIPELLEDGVSGWLVPERDEAALAAALASLAAEPERWAAMGRAGRAKVEREYDIHRLNDRLAGMLETLIRPEARPR